MVRPQFENAGIDWKDLARFHGFESSIRDKDDAGNPIGTVGLQDFKAPPDLTPENDPAAETAWLAARRSCMAIGFGGYPNFD